MTESGGLPEVQFESTVCLFPGSPLTFTEVNILLISCCPQHWPSPMSWSALTLSEVRCDLLKQSLFSFLQSQSRIGRNQAERTNEIKPFAWQQRVVFSRCLDLHRCQLGLIVLSLALMLSDVWSALTLSEERCASLTCNWSIRTSFLRLLVGLFRQLNMSKKTCFAISASYLWNVVLTHGRMPVTARRIGTISALTWDFIPVVKRFSILFVRWFSLSVFGCLRICAGEDVRSFCLWSSLPLPEALTPWWKPHESPLEHCPVACHCQQSPTFLSTLALFSFRLRVTTPPWIISFRALRFRLLIFWS